MGPKKRAHIKSFAFAPWHAPQRPSWETTDGNGRLGAEAMGTLGQTIRIVASG